MKENLILQFFLVVSIALQGQSIVGEWNLVEGKYNNSVIANLTGQLIITDVSADDSLNYKATFNNGTHSGIVRARYTIGGNKFDSNLNGASFLLNGFSSTYSIGPNGIIYNWRTSLSISSSAFNQWGGTAICYGNPSFSIAGNVLTLTSANGSAVLKYENEYPTAANEVVNTANNAIQVFPNPSEGIFHLFAKNQIQSYQLTLIDMQGRVLWNDEWDIADGIQKEIDLANLPNGLYLLRLSGKEYTIAKTLLIQK
jgi:type IX secretion system substrate protein